MDSRALIFSNLLNGVSIEQVAREFRKSEQEVKQVCAYVLRKVKSYCFLRQTQKGYVPIAASTIEQARKYRITCLTVLPKLKLDKEPEFKDIQNETVTQDNAIMIAKNLNT
jgi:hypothetical protein